jgi:hypothetical protein
MRNVVPILALLTLTTCSDGGTIPSPLVRVDLQDKLPAKVQRRLRAADTGFECHRKVGLTEQGASQQFIVTWRVFEAETGVRYITAVGVETDGPFTGARDPSGTAVVEDPRPREGGGNAVRVHIQWQATKGCSAISARTVEALDSQDPSCKPPRSGVKIFQQE